jgi:hypothetical protein
MKKKNKKLLMLGTRFQAIYGEQKWGKQWHLFSLVRHWPELVGKDFSQQSMPAFFRQAVLWVYARDSIWMQQMHLAKLQIMGRINALLPEECEIEDIRWTLEPADLVSIVEKEKYTSPPVQVEADAERHFRMMAETITDSATREALCNLWLQHETKKRVEQQTGQESTPKKQFGKS